MDTINFIISSETAKIFDFNSYIKNNGYRHYVVNYGPTHVYDSVIVDPRIDVNQQFILYKFNDQMLYLTNKDVEFDCTIS